MSIRIVMAAICIVGISISRPGVCDESSIVVQPADVYSAAQKALAEAGTIKAKIEMRVTYPATYSSTIEIIASADGRERAEIETTVNENTYRSLEVMSGGVLWLEQETVGGTLVSKIDLNVVKKTLAKDESAFAPLPVLGTNLLFDLSNLAKIVDFDKATEGTIGEEKVYVMTGGLKKMFEKGTRMLPAGAERWYSKASVYVRAEDFLPRRIELGEGKEGALMRLDFVEIERNTTVDEGTFRYTPGEDADVVDRTEWAIAELRGR